jgi:hypothetical protein
MEAVMIAVWSAETVFAVALNVAVTAVGGTTTELGTESTEFGLASETVAPPAFDTVTVQVLVWPENNVAGLHDNAVTTGAAVSLMDAVLVLPLSDAVTVAVWSAAIVPALAINVTMVALGGTVTNAGTASVTMLLLNATLPPPSWDSVAVQALVPPELNEVGEQLTAVIEGSVAVGVVPSVPPTPLIVSDFPAALAPRVFVTPTVATVAPGASVTLTTATAPFWISDPFNPYKMHVYSPTRELQLIDFPAARAVPAAATLIDAMLVGGYASVH